MNLPPFPEINDGDEVTFDTETNGLNWQVNRIVGFVITLPDRNFNAYYPIRHKTGPNLDAATTIEWVKSWAGKKITLIGHNLKFDLHMCAADGIFFPNAKFEDTQINATLLDEHMGSFSLESLGNQYKLPAKKGTYIYEYIASKVGCKPDKSSMAHYWELPADDPIAHEYAMADGEVTYLARQLQNEMIPYQGLTRIWEVESALVPVLMKMERRGVPIDMAALERLKTFIDKKLDAARLLLPADFNPRSPKMVAAALIKEGLSDADFPRTAIGNLSFTEKYLANSVTGRAIINVRKLTNLQNTFISGAVEDKLFEGRIHCNFNQMFDGEYGTLTGRLSSSGPNMQQVPKRDKLLAPIFRSIFVPEQGLEWDTNDYSQQEYRVFAMYSGSKYLAESYAAGRDMHQAVADELGVERDPSAKRLNLGMLYWMGAEKLAGSLGVSLEQAQFYRRSYDARIPEVKNFLNRAKESGERNGFVCTIMGRRQRFPNPRHAYKSSSRIIQGTCADIVKTKMVEVNSFLESETNGELGLILQVHDSLDWFRYPGAEELSREARRIMADMSTVSSQLTKIEMKVDSASGPSWGHASFPNQDWSVYEQEISGSELSDTIED